MFCGGVCVLEKGTGGSCEVFYLIFVAERGVIVAEGNVVGFRPEEFDFWAFLEEVFCPDAAVAGHEKYAESKMRWTAGVPVSDGGE